MKTIPLLEPTTLILPLKDAWNYPGSGYLDILFYYPQIENLQNVYMKKRNWKMIPEESPPEVRIWLLSPAENPSLTIDSQKFNSVHSEPAENKTTWFDFGIINKRFGWPRGFGQMRFRGITREESLVSILIITDQINSVLSKSIENAEMILQGITRENAGKTFINPSTVPVGSPVLFTLVYEAGHIGIPPGSRILLSIPKAFARPQILNKNADGWISVAWAERPCIIQNIEDAGPPYVNVCTICSLPEGLPPAGRIVFNYRTNFTYIFESTFEETEHRYWYSKTPPMNLSVAAVDNREIFVPVSHNNGHIIRFVPREPERLLLFLPGRRKYGKRIELSSIFTDRFRNISQPKAGWDITLKLEGSQSRNLGTLENRFVSPYKFTIQIKGLEPGIYRVSAIKTDTGQTISVSNPMEILPSRSRKPNIYWGEIHSHTQMSDGTGKFDELFKHARDAACLDFAAAADHAEFFTDNQWRWMQDIINAFNEDERFCTIVGYEWGELTGQQGHRNIYTSGKKLKPVRGDYEPTMYLDGLWKSLSKRKDIVCGPHANHCGTVENFLKYHNPYIERFFEIYSMWGTFDELANKLLNTGSILGFTGGGDCHEGKCFLSAEDQDKQGIIPHGFSAHIRFKCGITAAIMNKLNRNNLIEALRSRHTYATTGPRIILDFSVSGIKMGSKKSIKGLPVVHGEVHACGEIKCIDIIRDGKIIHSIPGKTTDIKFTWKDKHPGPCWYYFRVIQKDGERAWSSPVWVLKSTLHRTRNCNKIIGR